MYVKMAPTKTGRKIQQDFQHVQAAKLCLKDVIKILKKCRVSNIPKADYNNNLTEIWQQNIIFACSEKMM